ncbi:MAG: zf-HC2 domain-containing protein [Candidatus Methylomirabilales bacterium]
MDCQEALEHLQDLLGEELAEGQASTLKAHLSFCPGCAAEFHLQQEMRTTIKERATRHTAPPQLRARLLMAGAGRARGWLKGLVPAIAFLLILTLGTTLYLASLPSRPFAPLPLVVEAVNDYIRFAQRARPQDIGVSDRHQLLGWFQGKLDFGFDLPVEGGKEFQLVGGGLSYFLDRKVACLLYRKGPHLITLSVLRREGVEVPKGSSLKEKGIPLYLAKHRGFTVIVWERNDLLYSLVSDLEAKELSPLATSLAQS